jgi:hypothetical protein
MSTFTTTGETVRRATIPAPRPPADDTVVAEPVERQPEQHEEKPQLPEPRYPWPEPWGSYRGARPRSEFWDVATASWHSRGPYPQD